MAQKRRQAGGKYLLRAEPGELAGSKYRLQGWNRGVAAVLICESAHVIS
jgi:hypothetical protein